MLPLGSSITFYMRIILIVITIFISVIGQYSFAQDLSLGNIYNYVNSREQLSKEQKTLRKELRAEAKQNTASLQDNLTQLRDKGYFKYIHNNVQNDNAKYLLAIDRRLLVLQASLDSTLLTLQNSSWIDSLDVPVPHLTYYGDKGSSSQYYSSIDILRHFRKRYTSLVQKYPRDFEPLSIQTNEKFAYTILDFWKPTDGDNLKKLEQALLAREEDYKKSQMVIAEHRAKEAERLKKEAEARAQIAEEQRLAEEKQLNFEKKREAQIAQLPSTSAIKAKFRSYKHKTGHTFELFPVGFTPKPNKSTYDKVRMFGKVYTARYREYDANGINSLIIEFYDSGHILSVTVYKGGGSIYSAEYRDGANRPYAVYTKTADGKYHITFKRIYDMYLDRTTETYRYYAAEADYYYP